jgi:hypothetical protein
MKKLISTLLCALCMGTLNINAGIKITMGPESISTNPDSVYRYKLTGDFDMTNVNVSAWGGIEVVSINTADSTFSIRSKNGTTKEEYFSKWGKGRIQVFYDDGVCGQWTQKDVYKHFDMSNDNEWEHTIVAPSCISPGDTITVAVTPIVTMAFPQTPMERYKWTFPDGLIQKLLFCSVDSSSYSFIAGNIGVSETISVKLGLYNFDNPDNELTCTVHNAPPVPVISGPECLGYGEGATYNISNYSDDAIYTWYVNGVEVMTDVSGTTTLNIDNYSQFNTVDLEILVEANSIQGSCFGSIVGTFNAVRGFNDEEAWIAERNNRTFFNVGDPFNLNIAGSPVINYVTWEYPASWNLTASNVMGKNEGYIPESVTSLTGQVKAYVTAAGCSDTLTYDLYVKPGTVDSIVGAKTIYPGSYYTYKISNTPSPAPTGYKWEIPEGLSLITDYGDSVTVQANTTRGALEPFSVTPLGAYADSQVTNDDAASTPLTIGYAPDPAGPISVNKSCFNVNMPTSDVQFSVPAMTGHSFIWSVSSGLGSFDTTTNGNILSGSVDGTPGTYTVSVRSKSGPNVSDVIKTYEVTIVDDYELYADDFYSSYNFLYNGILIQNWNADDVDVILKYNGADVTDDYVIINPFYSYIGIGDPRANPMVPLENGYELTLIYTIPGGCKVKKVVIGGSIMKNAVIGYSSTEETDVSLAEKNSRHLLPASDEVFSLYPNPAKNFLYITIHNCDRDLSAKVSIYDMKGKLIYLEETNKPTTKVNIQNWDSGTYLILVKYANRYERKKIIKQ